MAGNILGALLLEIVTKANTSGLDKTDRSLKRTGKTLKNIHKEAGFLSKMTNRLMGGFSLYGVKNMFDSYLKFEKDLGAMRSRFYAITLDENKAGEEFEFIRKQATDLALDIKSTADSYSIFYSATRKALGEEGTRGVFENWTKVGRVLHLSEYQMERVTYALREMASKGAIYSQDLRMQIGTHVPNAMGLAQKAAEQLGFTGNDWFEKLQKSAKGNAKLTAEFVKLFSKEAEKAYASPEALKKAMQQPDALAKQISNIGYNFMVDFSKAGGSYMIVKVLQGISKVLLSIDYNKLTTSLGNIARTLGDLAQYLPILVHAIKNIAIAFLVIKSFSGITKGLAGIMLFIKTFKPLRLGTLIAKFGLRAVLFNTIWKSISKFFLGAGFRVALINGLRFVPVLGTIVSIISVIGAGIGIISKIIKNKWGDKPKVKLTEYLGDTGVKTETAFNIMKALQDKGITKRSELEKQLSYYKGGKEIAKYIDWNDKSQIILNFGDQQLTSQEIVKVAEQIQQNKIKKANTLFNKPVDKNAFSDPFFTGKK